MQVPGGRAETVVLSMADVPYDWQVASSSLQKDSEVDRARLFEFGAPSYDALADAPIEAAKFAKFDLPGMNPPVSVVVHGDKWNRKEVEEELRRISTYELRMMEGAPYDHYTFTVHLGEPPAAPGTPIKHPNPTTTPLRSPHQFSNTTTHNS